MKTKFFTLLFAVAASVGTMTAEIIKWVKIGDLYYNLDTSTKAAEVTSPDPNVGGSYSGDIVIPSTVTYRGTTYNVTSIGELAFDFDPITSVVIPSSVVTIGDYAFSDCDNLTSVTIPHGTTTIGDGAFSYCKNLTSVDIPATVNTIGIYAFNVSDKLTSVYIHDIAAWCVINFKMGMFGDDYSSNPLFYATKLYLNGTLITDLVIPESITKINPGSFYGCSRITSLTIGSNVKSIDKRAFYNCTHLQSVTCLAIEPPAMYGVVFEGVDCSQIPLYVPAESVSEYKMELQWEDFNPILPIGSHEAIEITSCEEFPAVKTIRDGQLLIERSGNIYNAQGAVVK